MGTFMSHYLSEFNHHFRPLSSHRLYRRKHYSHWITSSTVQPDISPSHISTSSQAFTSLLARHMASEKVTWPLPVCLGRTFKKIECEEFTWCNIVYLRWSKCRKTNECSMEIQVRSHKNILQRVFFLRTSLKICFCNARLWNILI